MVVLVMGIPGSAKTFQTAIFKVQIFCRLYCYVTEQWCHEGQNRRQKVVNRGAFRLCGGVDIQI